MNSYRVRPWTREDTSMYIQAREQRRSFLYRINKPTEEKDKRSSMFDDKDKGEAMKNQYKISEVFPDLQEKETLIVSTSAEMACRIPLKKHESKPSVTILKVSDDVEYRLLQIKTHCNGKLYTIDEIASVKKGGPFYHYEQEVMRTCPKETMKNTKGLLINAALGLSGEAGECADIIKKHVFQGHDLNRNKLMLELGDVLWYVTFACLSIDTTLGEIMEKNVNKLRTRYPDGFDINKSINRSDNE